MKYAILLCLLLAACAQSPEQGKIGIILPLSGDYGAFGADIENGARLYLETTDALIVPEDDQMDAKKSLSAYRKLRDVDDVTKIMGPVGAEAMQVIVGSMTEEDLRASYIVGIAACTPDFDNYTNALCAYPSLGAQVEDGNRFSASMNNTRVYIITENTAMGQYFIDSARRGAGRYQQTVVGEDRLAADSTGVLATVATKAKASEPDVIMLFSRDPARDFQLIQAFKDQGIPAMIISVNDINEEYLKEFNSTLEGVYVAGFTREEYDPVFVQKFEAKYGRKPNLYNAIGYEVAAGTYNSDSADTYKEYVSTHHAAVNMTYDGNQVYLPMQMKQVRNGSIVPVS